MAKSVTAWNLAPITGGKPAYQPAFPPSTRFVMRRMGSEPVISGQDKQLFFHITDLINGLIGIYWLRPTGRPLTSLPPPGTLRGVSSAFSSKGSEVINKLGCRAAYFSSERNGSVSSRMVLNLPSGAIQFDVPHHLIGGDRMTGAGRGLFAGSESTVITGNLVFIKMD